MLHCFLWNCCLSTISKDTRLWNLHSPIAAVAFGGGGVKYQWVRLFSQNIAEMVIYNKLIVTCKLSASSCCWTKRKSRKWLLWQFASTWFISELDLVVYHSWWLAMQLSIKFNTSGRYQIGYIELVISALFCLKQKWDFKCCWTITPNMPYRWSCWLRLLEVVVHR